MEALLEVEAGALYLRKKLILMGEVGGTESGSGV